MGIYKGAVMGPPQEFSKNIIRIYLPGSFCSLIGFLGSIGFGV